MKRNMTNRRIFRTLARDNCGESMEPSEDEIMYFGYHPNDEKCQGGIVACSSLQLGNADCVNCKKSEHYHWVTFLFVKKDYQMLGYGRQLIQYMETEGWNNLVRPFRTDSAYKALPFFERCGYTQIQGSRECVCSGSSLFRFLYLMEKEYPQHEEEDWDD